MKKLFAICLVIVMLSLSVVSSISASAYEDMPDGDVPILLDEEQITANRPVYSIDDAFSDNTILVIMKHENSLLNPVLDTDDFDKGLGISDVRRITRDGKANHIYLLTLDKKDKQNVLDVIEQLNKLDWVLTAEINAVAKPANEVSDELLNAVRNKHLDENIEKEDVLIDYIEEISQGKQLVRYSIRNYLYSCDVVEMRLGGYKLTVPARPVPEIYANGVLFDIEDAYDNGIINDSDLDCLPSLSNFELEKIGIIYGDSDRNWYLNIMDATVIQSYLAKVIDESYIDLILADYDRDGKVTVMDATAIQKILAQLT